MRSNGWYPIPHSQGSSARTQRAEDALSQGRVMRTLTRAALGTRASHAPASEFVKHISRLAFEGVPVGHKYHTRHHLKDVEFLAARCIQEYDAQDVRQPLSGLGIRSDFAILMDGVPVGGVRAFGRHGSVIVVCISSISPHTHRLHARLLT